MEAQVSAASVSPHEWSPGPDTSAIVQRIHAMLHPRNIVLVGATDKPGNYAERIWNNLIKYKFGGGLYPVNAKRETIWGVPCYKDFTSLPDKPDHVLVLVPARFAVQVIRDAAAAGARSATIVTSGFSELQDEDSQRLAVELQQAIRETGLAVTGPNCLGNLSAGENLFTNIDDRVVTMEAGPVAIAGQSGAIVMAIRQALEDRGVGVGYMVTTGNETGLETPDLMAYFAADPSVRVIVVYLEGVRNTKVFREACKAARAAGKPVIALKLGASEGGRAAAMAHTGALAGSIQTFDAISTREGVIRVRGLDQFVETAHADHAFARRDGIERLDRTGERAGMRHGGGATAFGRTELERNHRLSRGARSLAGFAKHLGVAHALEINHDHADARIGGEIAHQVGRLQPGLVSGRHHVADADAAILQRLADRHHDGAGLAGDRHRSCFHGDDAFVDVGEQVFAGAQIAETIRAGDRKPGLPNGLLQFGGEPLAFIVLQFAEARGDDGRRTGARRRRFANDLHREARRH